MIWVDRLALTWAMLLLIVIGLLRNGEHRPWIDDDVLLVVGVFTVFPWMFLRSLWWTITGR